MLVFGGWAGGVQQSSQQSLQPISPPPPPPPPPPTPHLHHVTTSERQTSSPPHWSSFKVAPLLPCRVSRTDNGNVTRGRALIEGSRKFSVEETDLKGFFCGVSLVRDIVAISPAVSLAFLKLWHCAFKMKKKNPQREMSAESNCYSFSFPLMKREHFHCDPAPCASKYTSFGY